ncbi:MAG: NAD(P)H-binding protein, partial [Candidatus Marinimicrobia bacterium]|nr:NAD(P)H-binding protein [Candidatus Neomarinimicrobiota bacterium]
MMNGNQNILVAGATGYVGGHLVPRLLQEGFQVRCMARSPDKLRDRDWQNIDIVHGDALKPESLNDALTDIQVAYYLIHSMGKAGDFESKDVKAARNFSRACAENGVERIIYLGGLGNSGDELSSHLKS